MLRQGKYEFLYVSIWWFFPFHNFGVRQYFSRLGNWITGCGCHYCESVGLYVPHDFRERLVAKLRFWVLLGIHQWLFLALSLFVLHDMSYPKNLFPFDCLCYSCRRDGPASKYYWLTQRVWGWRLAFVHLLEIAWTVAGTTRNCQRYLNEKMYKSQSPAPPDVSSSDHSRLVF